MKTSLYVLISTLVFVATVHGQITPPPGPVVPDCSNPPPDGTTHDPDGDCPEGSGTKGGGNYFDVFTGCVHREIKDLESAGSFAGKKLSFSRRTTSRYEGGVTTPFGSGGNWRHNFMWQITHTQPGSTPGIRIQTPRGSWYEFWQQIGQTFWTSPHPAVQQRVGQNPPDLHSASDSAKLPLDADRYYFYEPDGSRLAFRRGLNAQGQPIYWVEGWYDAYLNFTQFTLDAKGRVVTVTDPAGNSLVLQYTNIGNFSTGNVTLTFDPVNHPNVTGVTVPGSFNNWDVNAHPLLLGADGKWRITLPLQLGTWQYKFRLTGNWSGGVWVGDPGNGGNDYNIEVKVADQGLDNTTTQQVEFNYQNSSATSVKVAGSFNGWSTSTHVLTSLGNGHWRITMNLLPGIHQYKFVVNGSQWLLDPTNSFKVSNGSGGFNSRLAVGPVDEAITSVLSNSGSTPQRRVDYTYQTFVSGGSIYATLTSAMPQNVNATSTYTYGSPMQRNMGTRPSLATASDPLYSGTLKQVAYEYWQDQPNDNYDFGVEGMIRSEKNLANGETYCTVEGLIVGTQRSGRVVRYANGREDTYFRNTHQLKARFDDLGRSYTSEFWSDPNSGTGYGPDGVGMMRSHTDYRGNKTLYERTWHFGVIKKITLPDGAIRRTIYADETYPFHPWKEIDEHGHETVYTRNARHQPTRVDYADGTYETFQYNALGLLTEHRNRVGALTQHTYNGQQRQSTVQAAGTPVARTLLPTYANGVENGITDQGINRHQLEEYDAAGRHFHSRVSDGTPNLTYDQVLKTYDAMGRVSDVYSENGMQHWVYAYDAYSRVSTVTDPLGQITHYSYDSVGAGGGGCCGGSQAKPTLVTLPSGKKTFHEYDTLGRLERMTAGYQSLDATTTEYEYDDSGNLVKITQPGGAITEYGYDNRNRLDWMKDPLNRVTDYVYENLGLTVRTLLPDGTQTVKTTNPLTRVTTFVDQKGDITITETDAMGRQIRLTDAKNATRRWEYDALGRLVKRLHPDNSFEQWSYDSGGRALTYHTAAGAQLTRTYNLLDQVLTASWNDATPDSVYAYSLPGQPGSTLGRLQSVTTTSPDFTSALGYTYDALGRMTSELQDLTLNGSDPQSATVGYTYDADGNRSSLTYPSGAVLAYTYTGRNQLDTLSAGGPPPLVDYAYHADGRLLSRTLENGLVSTTTYDPAGQLELLEHSRNAVNIDSQDYLLHPQNGRRTGIQRPGGKNDTYSYDTLGQVTSGSYAATPTGAQTETFAYDAAGNRLTASRNSVNTSYTPNANDQYSTVSGQAQTHDLNGNMLLASVGTGAPPVTMTWDSENQMLTSASSTDRIVNTYDALHRRIAKQVWQNLPMAGWTCLKTITFTYDGWNVIEEKELDGSAGTPARHHRYTWGADLSGTLQGAGGVGGLLMAEELSTLNQPLSTPVAHYYWYDGNGNVAGLMSDTGLVEATHRYTSFGGDLETYITNPGTYASRNPWRFSNKYLDREVETTEGLYYYGYRHYLTALGRWTARDPIGELGGVNLYSFLTNQPLSSVDILGLAVCCPDGKVADFYGNCCETIKLYKDTSGNQKCGVAGTDDPDRGGGGIMDSLKQVTLSFNLDLGSGKRGFNMGVDIPLGPNAKGAFSMGVGIGIGAGASLGLKVPGPSLDRPGDAGVKFSGSGGNGRAGGTVDVEFTPSGMGSSLTMGLGIGAGASITAFGNVR